MTAGGATGTDVDGARRTLEAFADPGVDYDDVTATLEREGVRRFVESFEQLFDGVVRKRHSMIAS